MKPLEEITDKAQRPYLSFALDELPEPLAERLHDMPEYDFVKWSEAKRALPPGIVDNLAGYWWIPDNPATEDDNQGFERFMPEHSTLYYMQHEDLFLPASEDEQSTLRRAARISAGGGLGYHQFVPAKPYRVFATKGGARRREQADPSYYMGANIKGYFASPRAEAVMAKASLGLIETCDIVLEPNGCTLRDEVLERRLVDVLGRWQPFDLLRSELSWLKINGRYEIKRTAKVVLRSDIPPELGLFRPMMFQGIVYCRTSFIDDLKAAGAHAARGWELEVGPPHRPNHNPPWWRGYDI